MTMATTNDKRDFRRQIFFSLGGIVIGLAVAGLLALLINNVVEPTMQVETQDLVEFPGDVFSIWYHTESPNMSTRSALLDRLEDSLSDLLIRLDVTIDDIPLPIDVLVHDSPEMMQQTTMRRKSGSAMYSFYSVIDLLQGEDPYSRLSELVLAFGWGRCSSQVLYRGMLMNISAANEDFHVPVAAAPARLLYSLEDLLMLEKIDAFEDTLYQRYQSPFSARLAMGTLEGLSEFRSMFTTVGDSAEYGIADLQAASLVQYLIGCAGGLEAFREVWGPGTSEALITRLACGPWSDLFDDWLTVARSVDPSTAAYQRYRARFLYEAGDIEAAAQITETWRPNDLPSADSVLAVRAQLAAGHFEAASRFANAAEPGISEVLVDWVAVYNGWKQVSDGTLTVFSRGTKAELDARLQEVKAAYVRAATFFGFSESELPEHASVFYYGSASTRDTGEAILPAADIHKAIWHFCPEDNMVVEFAGSMPSFVTMKSSASTLLRRGLTAVLTVDRDELISRGCEMLRLAEWTPLWRIGFGGMPDRPFETETGLMIGYILDTFGSDVVRGLWIATARIGGGVSLDTAIQSALGTSRTEIERTLVDSVLICD
ncbi:hypothetical protein KKG90_04620 [Candidatus Bipolaricaulota bacterium]|nr:hypothetical protein [Candidatus Bipolaricaulota bacterium]